MRNAAEWIIVAILLCGCGNKTPEPAPTSQPAQRVRAAKPADLAKPVDTAKPGEVPVLDAAVCGKRDGLFGPFAMDGAQAKGRYGANAKTYADAPTTLQRAIEVCGIPASRAWLKRTTCADGSVAKQNGRHGSFGAGGRCGSTIDRYGVSCPEGDYEVYIDVYMCGPGESPS